MIRLIGILAGLFFAASVQPSLLPRAGYVQGIASGITLMIGYGLGAGGQHLGGRHPAGGGEPAQVLDRVSQRGSAR